ncbi:MAG: hypothetical protein ABR499_13045 [Gemmatimonadaceae bacterium]
MRHHINPRVVFAIGGLGILAASTPGLSYVVPAAAPLDQISAEKQTRLAVGRHMRTRATLYKESGQILAETRIWTNNEFSGFTGAAGILVIDASGKVVATAENWPMGVDGRYVPGKPSDRTIPWRATVPREAAAVAVRLEIVHVHRGLNRFGAILKEAGERAAQFVAFWREFCREYPDICSSGEPTTTKPAELSNVPKPRTREVNPPPEK